MKPTLGLTGLTMNAMALIAPGAFVWLTFSTQSLYGAPMAGIDMWFGVVAALVLCFATAISYAELSKLYPGAGSSYFFAEQAFLAKTRYVTFARAAKFIIGWSSHLYYWIYPGVMVGFTALVVGYVAGILWPETFSASIPSPLFMILVCVVFTIVISYIAHLGVTGSTAVNIAINIIQISALLLFSVMAIGYRSSHPEGSIGYTLDPDGVPTQYVVALFATDKDCKPIKDEKTGEWVPDKDGKPIKDEKTGEWLTEKDENGKPRMLELTYKEPISQEPDKDNPNGPKIATHNYFENAPAVVKPHGFSYVIIQACIAILILVGFESVTSMGEEAKNAKRDIPRAVLLSLFIQGVLCYLIGYFGSNYFLNSGYNSPTASGSVAPIADMCYIIGTWFFGSTSAAKIFVLVMAGTVLVALIGTTLSCINTGARVTYAMGRDEEVPVHFGMLHGKNLSPHRAIWTLAVVSIIVGIFAVYFNFCGGAAQKDADVAALPKNFWYSFGLWPQATAESLPQGILVVALASNFGTFLLYMLTNAIAIEAFREHHSFSGFKHMVVPVFGLIANLVCMLFYLIGPLPGIVAKMRWQEPYAALGIAAVWGIYGWVYFAISSKRKKAKSTGSSAPLNATAKA
jgi:amino acid transporter